MNRIYTVTNSFLTIKISDEQLIAINERIDPIVDRWKRNIINDKAMCIYELARDCYLQGLIDASSAEVRNELAKEKINDESQVNKGTED